MDKSTPHIIPVSPITIAMGIKVKYVRSYGNDRYYPACELSKMICELLNQKSLTMEQLEKIKAYGYQLEMEKENG